MNLSSRIPSRAQRAYGDDGRKYQQPSPSLGAMLVDVCLVLVWGASIPLLMWLGVAGGF